MNKLSFNNRKTKYTLFHKTSFKDDLPLKLPALQITILKEKQQHGVMLDENISWEEHIRKFEAKLAKILDYYTVQSLYFKKNILKVFILHIFIHT